MSHPPTAGGYDPEPYHEKYQVTRSDGRDAPGEPHHGCELFVLDLRHDPHARRAASAYIASAVGVRPPLVDHLAVTLYRLDQEHPIT